MVVGSNPILAANIIKMERTEIKTEYKSLLRDDIDIVFSGMNSKGEFVLGSIIEEDDEKKVVREFRSIVSEKDLTEFENGEMTYLEVLKRTKDIYMTEVPYSGETGFEEKVEFGSIPEDILPLEDSYINRKNK